MNTLFFYSMNSCIMLILVIIMSLITVAFLTLFERKIMGMYHIRLGPNKVSIFGILQPFSDALKLINKEFFFPNKSNLNIFMLSPMLMFLLSLLMWMIYPFQTNLLMFNYSTLYFLSIMSMGVYGLIFTGWSSNSNYSMIGAIRSIAQSIFYEINFAILILIILMMINTLNLFNIQLFNKYNFLMFLFPMILLFISILAEINCTPFDLSESEFELISGFNIEYASSKFILIFLAEYSSILIMILLFSMIFFLTPNMNIQFYLIMTLIFFFITWIRMTLPRLRYDKLMILCWTFMLPMTLISFMNYLIVYKLNCDLILFN
uniref:NADH-ubiquinone oxidoreductase chain 1 n=1 Tax=Cardiochiles fuscipennis TaxID=69312 RepID=A0A0A6ZKP9_9HYME|nr:NADH dehydrogenase subunit 1 [Cardiochiles fuscipennis]